MDSPDDPQWSLARKQFLADEVDRLADRAPDADRSPTILARQFAAIAAQLFSPGTLDEVLARIATVAVDVVPGCDLASITLLRDGVPTTPFATDRDAAAADHAQYDAGEGPCLSALTEPVVHAPRLHDDPRWPGFAGSAPTRLQSVASFGMYEAWSNAPAPRAALNLYGIKPEAFTEESRELGLVLAAHGASALLVADERERRDDEFRTALLSRDVIGQAKGIIMERAKVTADEAFEVLRRTSQAYNRKLRDIAARLALTGELPAADDGPHAPSDEHSS